jgi:hypothetical protein
MLCAACNVNPKQTGKFHCTSFLWRTVKCRLLVRTVLPRPLRLKQLHQEGGISNAFLREGRHLYANGIYQKMI